MQLKSASVVAPEIAVEVQPLRSISEPFLLPAAENWSRLQDKCWHQIRNLIFIAKPRRRTNLDDNTEL